MWVMLELLYSSDKKWLETFVYLCLLKLKFCSSVVKIQKKQMEMSKPIYSIIYHAIVQISYRIQNSNNNSNILFNIKQINNKHYYTQVIDFYDSLLKE